MTYFFAVTYSLHSPRIPIREMVHSGFDEWKIDTQKSYTGYYFSQLTKIRQGKAPMVVEWGAWYSTKAAYAWKMEKKVFVFANQ